MCGWVFVDSLSAQSLFSAVTPSSRSYAANKNHCTTPPHTYTQQKQHLKTSPLPNTTWRPSSQLVVTVVMKNWLPLVLGPCCVLCFVLFLHVVGGVACSERYPLLSSLPLCLCLATLPGTKHTPPAHAYNRRTKSSAGAGQRQQQHKQHNTHTCTTQQTAHTKKQHHNNTTNHQPTCVGH